MIVASTTSRGWGDNIYQFLTDLYSRWNVSFSRGNMVMFKRKIFTNLSLNFTQFIQDAWRQKIIH